MAEDEDILDDLEDAEAAGTGAGGGGRLEDRTQGLSDHKGGDSGWFESSFQAAVTRGRSR